MIIPIDSTTLEALYQNGQISAEGLAAIAPIQWLVDRHPELINSSEKAMNAFRATQTQPLTCKACIHFSSIHQCCMTRIDGKATYLPVNENTRACGDYEGVTLLPFLNIGGDIS